jgi:hypothetical protein
MDPYAKKLPVLTDFVSEFGIAPSLTADGRVQLIKDTREGITNDGFTVVADYTASGVSAEMKTVAGVTDASVIVRNASPLSLSGNAEALLVSSSSSVCEAGGAVVSSTGKYTVAAYSETENEGVKSTVFVIPSVYLSASDALVSRGYSNKDFTYALFEELFGAEELPYGCRAIVYDTNTLENLTMGTARIITALLLSIPAVIAVAGAVVVTRRKNR